MRSKAAKLAAATAAANKHSPSQQSTSTKTPTAKASHTGTVISLQVDNSTAQSSLRPPSKAKGSSSGGMASQAAEQGIRAANLRATMSTTQSQGSLQQQDEGHQQPRKGTETSHRKSTSLTHTKESLQANGSPTGTRVKKNVKSLSSRGLVSNMGQSHHQQSQSRAKAAASSQLAQQTIGMRRNTLSGQAAKQRPRLAETDQYEANTAAFEGTDDNHLPATQAERQKLIQQGHTSMAPPTSMAATQQKSKKKNASSTPTSKNLAMQQRQAVTHGRDHQLHRPVNSVQISTTSGGVGGVTTPYAKSQNTLNQMRKKSSTERSLLQTAFVKNPRLKASGAQLTLGPHKFITFIGPPTAYQTRQRNRIQTPTSTIQSVSKTGKGLSSTLDAQTRSTLLYEENSERKLQHEIEASDDAPYKPSTSGFRHNQNKIIGAVQDQPRLTMEYPATYIIEGQRAHTASGSALPSNHHLTSPDRHCATEGADEVNELGASHGTVGQSKARNGRGGSDGDIQTLLLIRGSRSNGDLRAPPQTARDGKGLPSAPKLLNEARPGNNYLPHQHFMTTQGNEETDGNQTYDGQTTTVTHPYRTENQKIEYVTKSYSGSAWCCQSSEGAYDQSQIDISKKPIPQPAAPKQLSLKEKVVEMIGWGSCARAQPKDQHLTLETPPQISKVPNKSIRVVPHQSIGSSGAASTAVQSGHCPLQKLKLSSPPPIGSIPRTRRQQLGLTPQTNMRLFRCDERVGRKSILSNQSIVPCSEDDSFIESGVGGRLDRESIISIKAAQQNNLGRRGGTGVDHNTATSSGANTARQPAGYPQASAQNLSQYNAAKSALQANASLQEERKHQQLVVEASLRGSAITPLGGVSGSRSGNLRQNANLIQLLKSEKQSTNSYDYKSSIKTGSTPRDAGSIIENLHALNINIQKREKELAMRAAGQPQEELERRRQALINADSNSVNSQIPCETDSAGGPPTTLTRYEEVKTISQQQEDSHRGAAPAQATSSLEAERMPAVQGRREGPSSTKHSISVNFESVIMLENKLSRVAKSLVMVKFAEQQTNQPHKSERQLNSAIQNYQMQHEELISLCEEYWTILRQEASLFCSLPQRMFKKQTRLVSEIRKSFILKLLVVSQVGFLTSNEEFHFNDSFLKEQMDSVSVAFLIFMRVILGKLTPPMLQNYFWARKLHSVVEQKLEVIRAEHTGVTARQDTAPNGDGSVAPELVRISQAQAISELVAVNAQTRDLLVAMYEEMESIRQDEELRDNSKYEHPLFQTVQEILGALDTVSFKDASTLVGRSLVNEFAELDSSDSVSGEDAYNTLRRNEAVSGSPMNQQVKAPFLPPMAPGKEYTLVLDLDETLVHYYEEKNTVLLRPFASQFLQQMAQFYEVVIFTAGTKDYADWALAHLNNQAAYYYIDHRLYRDHTIQCMDVFIKDLSQLGRNLDKTIIVDNITENFLLQPDNGISIKSWFDDPEDTALADMAPLLRQIVEQMVPDVRLALKESKDQLLAAIAQGEVNPTQRLKQLSFSDRSDGLSSSNAHSSLVRDAAGASVVSDQRLNHRSNMEPNPYSAHHHQVQNVALDHN